MKQAKLNFLERAIGLVSPTLALKRARARFILNEVRGYEGSSRTPRTKNWKTSPGSANLEIQTSLLTLRDRARDLVRNNPYSKKAITVISTNVVGSGIRPRIDTKGRDAKKLMDLWKKWAEKTECDFDGMLTMYGLQKLIMRSLSEGGDVLIRRRRVSNGLLPVQIQVVEGDLLDQNRTTPLEGGGYIVQGVEFDKNGKRVAYWVFERHPYDVVPNTMLSYRVSSSEIIHVFETLRPGQARGVPAGTSAFIRLKDFDDYEDAQLMRQKIAACFAVFVHDQSEDLTGAIADTDTEDDGSISERVQPGVIEHLPPGKNITFATPPGTEGYGEYAKNVLRAIAAAYGVTYEALTGDLSNVNFSSGRMGWLEFHRQVSDWQDNVMLPACDKIWNWFVESANMAGIISKTDIVASWTPPRREMIDPVKEIKAMTDEVRAGFTSWAEAVSSRGWDPQELLIALKEEYALFEEFKLMLTCDPRFDPTRPVPPIQGPNRQAPSGQTNNNQ
jgi:lambda family phage portal protein